MKKFFVILIGIISLLLIASRIGHYLDKKVISSKQVVFKIHLDIDREEVDDFFHLTEGTYDKEKMRIICIIPASEHYRPFYNSVYFRSNIDCDEEYIKEKHRKYEPYELNNNMIFELILTKDLHTTPAMIYKEWGNEVIARFPFRYDYKKGKINQIVISKNGVSDYCE